VISFSCFGFVAVVLGNPETQTVSHFFPKPCAALQRKFGTDAAIASRRLEFYKCSQLFIGGSNETLSVVAISVSNPDRSPVGIHGCDAASTPAGFGEIVSDYFPTFHTRRIVPLLPLAMWKQG
jgi:hypothetical protein